MNKKQKSAVICALADLIGSAQAYTQGDSNIHAWAAHLDSIRELAEEFPDLSDDYTDAITKLELDMADKGNV